MFYGIKGDDVNPGCYLFARFCLKTQVTPGIAAPLAEIAVFTWVLFQASILLRDID
jgi:hypothetical protein